MREETGDGSDNNNSQSVVEKDKSLDRRQSIESMKSLEQVATDEEFVGPEFEEDAYYCYSLAATPSFDDLDASDSEEILVHWHHDTGEIEEIDVVDFQQHQQLQHCDNPSEAGTAIPANVHHTTRGELRRLRARLRDRLLSLVKRGAQLIISSAGFFHIYI